MTVIAYRDGVMAADSGAFMGSCKLACAVKVARGPDGTLYGYSGEVAAGEAFLDWVRAGADGEPPTIRRTANETDAAIHVLRVRPGRDPERLTGYGVEVWCGMPYAAIGSACEAALGALHAGASAVAAVEAAIAHHTEAHGPVRTITHD